MPDVSMKNLLEAGVHFGHQTHRWNPKMKQFIFGPRNGIYIIDLEKTVRHAKDACTFVKNTVADGGKILFVATKKQAKDIAKQAAERAGMPNVTERWLGGTLTNFQTIRRGCDKLDQFDTWEKDGTYEALPKKEVVVLERKRKKLLASLGGVRHMRSLPSALFIIDPEMEAIAVREANRLGVPVVAVVDTNCDPDPIDYVIPGNDDALKSVTLFVNLIADACIEGSSLFEQRMRQGSGQQDGEPRMPGAAPIVERVRVKQPHVAHVKNIPTDIDYRVDSTGEEPAEVGDVPVVEAPPADAATPEEVAAATVNPAEAAEPVAVPLEKLAKPEKPKAKEKAKDKKK